MACVNSLPLLRKSTRGHRLSRLLFTYAQVAYPIIRKEFGHFQCVAESRITVEVLSRLGIRARAQEVTLTAGFPDKDIGIHLGTTAEKLRSLGVTVAPWQFDNKGTWGGHLVVVVDSLDGQAYIVDPSFDQVIEQLHAGVSFRLTPKIEIWPISQASTIKRGVEIPTRTECGQKFLAIYTAKQGMGHRKQRGWKDERIPAITERILSGMRQAA